MGQDTILGTDTTADALITKINNDIAELFSAVAALSGSAILISENDSTPGFFDGKAVAGEGITFTINNEGGNESLTIAFSGDRNTQIEFRNLAFSIMFG